MSTTLVYLMVCDWDLNDVNNNNNNNNNIRVIRSVYGLLSSGSSATGSGRCVSSLFEVTITKTLIPDRN